AEGAIARQLAEEHPGLVLTHQRGPFHRVIAQILHDALHRGRVLPRIGAQQAALAHQRADGDVFTPVLARITDTDDLTAGIAQPAGALDLQEEEFHRVRRPGDFQPPPSERARLYFRPVKIGHETAAFVIAAEGRLSGALIGRHIFWPGTYEIGRQAIDGHVETG